MGPLDTWQRTDAGLAVTPGAGEDTVTAPAGTGATLYEPAAGKNVASGVTIAYSFEIRATTSDGATVTRPDGTTVAVTDAAWTTVAGEHVYDGGALLFGLSLSAGASVRMRAVSVADRDGYTVTTAAADATGAGAETASQNGTETVTIPGEGGTPGISASGTGAETDSTAGSETVTTEVPNDGNVSNGDGTQSWTFRRAAGDVADVGARIYAGSVVLDYGVPGDALQETTVLDATSTGYVQGLTWHDDDADGVPDRYDVQYRLGDLAGMALPGIGALSGNGLRTERLYAYTDDQNFLVAEPGRFEVRLGGGDLAGTLSGYGVQLTDHNTRITTAQTDASTAIGNASAAQQTADDAYTGAAGTAHAGFVAQRDPALGYATASGVAAVEVADADGTLRSISGTVAQTYADKARLDNLAVYEIADGAGTTRTLAGLAALTNEHEGTLSAVAGYSYTDSAGVTRQRLAGLVARADASGAVADVVAAYTDGAGVVTGAAGLTAEASASHAQTEVLASYSGPNGAGAAGLTAQVDAVGSRAVLGVRADGRAAYLNLGVGTFGSDVTLSADSVDVYAIARFAGRGQDVDSHFRQGAGGWAVDDLASLSPAATNAAVSYPRATGENAGAGVTATGRYHVAPVALVPYEAGKRYRVRVRGRSAVAGQTAQVQVGVSYFRGGAHVGTPIVGHKTFGAGQPYADVSIDVSLPADTDAWRPVVILNSTAAFTAAPGRVELDSVEVVALTAFGDLDETIIQGGKIISDRISLSGLLETQDATVRRTLTMGAGSTLRAASGAYTLTDQAAHFGVNTTFAGVLDGASGRFSGTLTVDGAFVLGNGLRFEGGALGQISLQAGGHNLVLGSALSPDASTPRQLGTADANAPLVQVAEAYGSDQDPVAATRSTTFEAVASSGTFRISVPYSYGTQAYGSGSASASVQVRVYRNGALQGSAGATYGASGPGGGGNGTHTATLSGSGTVRVEVTVDTSASRGGGTSAFDSAEANAQAGAAAVSHEAAGDPNLSFVSTNGVFYQGANGFEAGVRRQESQVFAREVRLDDNEGTGGYVVLRFRNAGTADESLQIERFSSGASVGNTSIRLRTGDVLPY